MRDQAHELRSLKMESALADANAPGPRPRTIVVTGGKGGVGISTLAVNLAASLSREGKRVLLASASAQPHDIALICGITDFPESADWMQPLQGPAGLLILPHRLADCESTPCTARVFESIARLGNCADLAIVDVGNRFVAQDPALLAVTDILLYVTTSDNVAIMDTYAAIKDLVNRCGQPESTCDAQRDDLPPLALLVNRCRETNAARCTHDRIAATCQRFLRTPIQFVGEVPDDSSLCTALTASLPAVLQSPNSAAAKAIGRAAAIVARN